MKKLILFTAIVLSAWTIQAQNASINGKVSDADGNPLVGASVTIQNTQKGTITDNQGSYSLGGLEAGSYTIAVSYIGFSESSKEVKLGADQTLSLNFELEGGTFFSDQVVISSSKTPEKITESPATIIAVSAKQIDEYAGNPAELLARQKGVDYFRAGIATPALNIRGFNSNFNAKNLQVTDGRFSTLIATGLPLGPLNTSIKEDIEQVEVILGPNATMYGPNAHNGLLNIITKDPRTSEGTTFVLNPGVNGDGNLFYSGRFRHAQVINDKFAYKVVGEYTRGTEFDWADSVFIDRVGAFDSLGNPIPDGIREGYEELELDPEVSFLRTEAAFYYSPTKDADIILNWGRSNSNYLSPTNVGRNQIKDWAINYYQLRFSSKHWFAQAYFTQSRTDSTYAIDERTKQYYRLLDSGLPDAEARGDLSYASGALFQDRSQRANAEVQYNNQFGRLTLSVGGQWQLDQANSLGTYLLDENEDDFININQYGAYLHLKYDFNEKWKAVAAARADYHEVYEFNFIPKFALLRQGKNGTFRFTYSQGIAAPTILNMYGNLFGGLILGNAEGFTLADGSTVAKQTVEKIQTFEVGYRGITAGNKLVIDANAYFNISRDFLSPVTIVGVTTQRGDTPIEEVQSGFDAYGGLVATYINFGEVNTYGVDLSATYHFNGAFNAYVNYSWFDWSVDEEDLSNDFNGDGVVDFLDILVNAPNHKAGIGMNYSGKKFYANGYLRWVQAYDYFSSFQIASRTQPDKSYRGVAIVEGARSADTFNYGPLGGFSTVDIGLGYRFNDNFRLGFAASNLFNQALREFTASAPTRGLYTIELRVDLPGIK
ncbi:MAG: TonB-dependent receptor [Bacteroidota bacterium]